jgi:AcrR family transcriptional regulator
MALAKADSGAVDSRNGQHPPDVRKIHVRPGGRTSRDPAAMKQAPEDRRKSRTRSASLKAFSELFLERGYEAVTVSDVAEHAGIGRSTLYEHFRTKDALLQASLDGPFGVLATTVVPDADPGPLQALLDHIRAHAGVARLLLAQPLRSRIARVLADRIAAQLRAPGLYPRCHPLAAELRTIALAEAQLTLIERWLFGPVALPVEAIAQELRRLADIVVAQ